MGGLYFHWIRSSLFDCKRDSRWHLLDGCPLLIDAGGALYYNEEKGTCGKRGMRE